MRSIYTKHFFDRSGLRIVVTMTVMIFAVALFWVGVAAAASQQQAAPATGEHLVTVYDAQQKQVILTKSATVRQVLEQAHVTIATHDVVEPSLDTVIRSSDFTVNIYRAHPVLIIDGMRRMRVLSSHSSPRDIAKDAHIALRDEDVVTIQKPTDILEAGGGMSLQIKRATPVRLLLYGNDTVVYTQAQTVAGLLSEKEIDLGKHDTVSVDLATAITAGMRIEIWRDGVQTVTRDEAIPFPVRQIEDMSRPVGYKKIQSPGRDGKKSVTYEVTIKNGKQIKRKKIQSVVLKKPVEQVEVVGAKPSFSGDFAEALAKLRSCEGGYQSWNPAGPYYGAYQFDAGTWASVSKAPYGNATPAQQDEAARKLYERRGWQPWPVCGASLPDVYR